MKTTLEMPDTLFRKLKAHAAERGTTIKIVVTEAVQEKLSLGGTRHQRAKGWRSVFGAVPGSARDIDRIVAAEFETIDPVDWK